MTDKELQLRQQIKKISNKGHSLQIFGKATADQMEFDELMDIPTLKRLLRKLERLEVTRANTAHGG